MRNLLFSGKVLAFAAVLAGGLKDATAQWNATFRNHSILMYKPAELPSAKVTEAPSFAHRHFWILQKSEPFNSHTISALRIAGVEIGFPVSKNLYTCSTPDGFSTATLSSFGIEGISPYPPLISIGDDSGNEAEKAFNPEIRVQVLPHPGLKQELILRNWKPSWGILEGVWSGKLTKWVVRCQPTQLDSLRLSGWVQWMEPADNEIVPFNGEAAAHSRTNLLKTSGMGWAEGLSGTGVTIAIGDGGMVTSHSDLESHQENLTPSKIPSFGNHQDHVTGTVAGSGLLNQEFEGMAPKAQVLNAQTSFVISNGVALHTEDKVVLTNNSYGIAYSCSRAGSYSATSAYIDDQLFNNSQLLHVFAAGNQGYVNCSPYPTGFKTIADGYPVSKNVLTVGATLPKDEFAWFSSAGPAKDGRIKPEIVADGNDLSSTVPTDQYEKKSGTSMAAPVVTGTLALLVERYRQLHGGQNPESALLKGLVCNTAEDLGLPNVDYTYGYGRLNARKARKVLENQWYKMGEVADGGLNEFTIQALPQAKLLKVMLVWTDPAGYPGNERALVNDLNLEVVVNGQVFHPWVMNSLPDAVAQASTRGIDSLNNQEQVTVDVNGSESILVRVSGKNLGTATQKFWVVYDWISPELVLTYPASQQKVTSNQTLPIRWDINLLSLSNFRLEVSSDGGQSWNIAKTISKPDSLYTDWSVPAATFASYKIRLVGDHAGMPVYSNVVDVSASLAPQASVEECNQALRILWNSVDQATRYEVLVLDKTAGNWVSKGFTIGNSFILNQLENGISKAIAVRAWKGTMSGLPTKAVLGVPHPGACPWSGDLRLVQISSHQDGRKYTSTDPGSATPIWLRVQNAGQTSITNQQIGIYYRAISGVVSSTTTSISVAADEVTEISLPWTLDISEPGDYPVSFWLQNDLDPNRGNDTLRQVLRILENDPVALPWSFTGENVMQTSALSISGLPGAPQIDFVSNAKARISTTSSMLPSDFGSRSLVLDKQKVDGTIGSGELILTLNLSGYPGAGRLYLDFDLFPFGSLSTGNALLVRPNDQAVWVEVMQFSNENVPPGQVKKFRVIDLAPFLSGQSLSSSFQLKFLQAGFKPSTIINGEGYAIDNLVISFPTNDLSVSRFLAPGNGCQYDSPRKVKVRIQNYATSAHNSVSVGYVMGSQAPVVEEISSIGAGDSIDYEFQAMVPSQAIGRLDFKVWVHVGDDGYPGNDTLRNQVVFIAPNISVYPYYEGFEADHGHWETYGTHNSWDWGSPAKGLAIVDTAANGNRMWGTGLSGAYSANQVSFLQSPCFNLSDLQGDVQFSFNSVYSMEPDYDYAWLEFSEDGEHWKKIGSKGVGTNWYTHESDQWNGLSKRWQVHSISLSLAGMTDKSRVRFRFGFSSDASIVSEGFGIDDIHLEPAFHIVEDSVYSQMLPQQDGFAWNEFGPQPDKIASVENATDLGTISLKMKRNTGMIRYHENVPYLDRNFLIKPSIQPDKPVKVRLYITDAEVKALEQADASMTSFQELGIYKYDGSNEDLSLVNNLVTSTSELFIPAAQVQKTPTAGGYFLEFSVESFSEFYIATRSLSGPDDPLPIELISFKAQKINFKPDVELSWKTASERNADYFELQFSCDGRSFESIYSTSAQGSEVAGYQYQTSHYPPQCSQPQLYYRLLQFDKNSITPATYLATCSNDLRGYGIRVQSRVQNVLGISGLSSTCQLVLYDALGKPHLNQFHQESDLQLDVRNLPSGTYWLGVYTDAGMERFPIMKE